MILFSVYHSVYIVTKKALLFFLIASYPSVLIQMVLVCCHREGGRAVA